MAKAGFIHDKLDIKFLVLYLMARVASPVDFSTLADLTFCDDGVEYFDFYLLHNVYEKSIETYTDPRWGIIDYFLEQKKNGRIRHLGFSSHGGLELLESLLGKTNATAASDFGVACLSLRAGMQGAWLNVCINTGSLHDAAFAAGARAAGQKLLDTGLPRADRCYAAMLAACSEK